jgi:hypothetical protein
MYLNLSEPQDAVTNDKTDINDGITATRLVPVIEEEAGEMYGGAVRWCIQGLDSAAKTLEMMSLRAKLSRRWCRNWNVIGKRMH